MFSGIIRSVGEITGVNIGVETGRLQIRASEFAESAPGDSVAVCGVCLTVVQNDAGLIAFDVGSETLRRTTLGGLKAGGLVNLESPLRLNDLLHGHLVQGHVDCVAKVTAVDVEGETRKITFQIPREYSRYLVPKGSVSVDGVSLTIGECGEGSFSVYIVPATWERTNFRGYDARTLVNIEVDIIAKYVERLTKVSRESGQAGV